MEPGRHKFLLGGVGAVCLIGVIVGVSVFATQKAEQPPSAAADRAIWILERMPVIDGHNDFPWQARNMVFNDLSKFDFRKNLSEIEPWKSNPESFTDIPRLRAGHVGGQFWVAYTACRSQYKDSVPQTLEQIDFIKRLAANYSDDLFFATSAADIENAIAQKKVASLIGIEGGHSIQASFSVLRLMYEMGARYMTLTHGCNLPFADAAQVDGGGLEPSHNGLNSFGLDIVEEMNRLGMIVDLSHVSMKTMEAAIKKSRAPVIFSHSSAKSICNHFRNVDDDILHMVKENRGLVMVNFYWNFVQCDRTKNATIADVIAHIEHIRNISGVDAVGIGADYDGVDKVPQGLDDVSKYPALFTALIETGRWTDEDLEKLAGRNLIRVFKEVEKIRNEMANVPPHQNVITKADVEKANVNLTCVTARFIDEPKKDENEERRKRDISSSPEEL